MESEESFVRAEGDFRLALLFFPLLVPSSDQFACISVVLYTSP